MNQNFSTEQLFSLCTKYDLRKYSISKQDVLKRIEKKIASLSDGTFEFDLTVRNEYVTTSNIENELILRKINDNIKKLYKDTQNNRNFIIKQLIALLNETTPMMILKTDINSFYESIQRKKILEKLSADQILSYNTTELLSIFFNHPFNKPNKGLPRGVNISATLSELYMRRFDKWIRSHNGVYYYARYVDDIIIFFNNKKNMVLVRNSLYEKLNDGLSINHRKTDFFDGNDISDTKPLQFLGYQFTSRKVKRKKTVNIAIAQKKINKIKTRIVKSFLEYIKTKDFDLLEQRVKFLTGNHVVRKSHSGSVLKSGIYYSYSKITDQMPLNELNIFYHKILNSHKGSFGSKITSELNFSKKQKLTKYSFRHGFNKKVSYNFQDKALVKIQKCWL